jgi:hypothetical protein
MSRSPAEDTAQRVRTIRMAAASISQLLVDKALPDEAWERAARVLIRCRQARCALERGEGVDPPSGN